VLVLDGYLGPSPPAGIPAVQWPEVQRGQISAWAGDRGWRLARIFEDHETDGRRDGSPALLAAISRVESRETDGIVVSALRVVADSLPEAVLALERIQAAGGVFVSVSDGIDLSQPCGRLILRLLVSLLDWGWLS
jgi:hypothetical protein